MQTVKILHLIPGVEEKKGVGGAETLLLSLLKKIDGKRFKFIIAYSPGAPLTDDFKKAGAEVIPFSTSSKFDMFAIYKLVKLINVKNINLVHSHYPRRDFLGCFAAKISKVPFVFTRHLSISEFPIKKIVRKLYMAVDSFIAVKYADKIVAASKAIADDLIIKERAKKSKMSVIYAGLDLDTYGKDVEIGKIRREYNIGEKTPLIGTVGRINAQKAHQYFLKAIVEVLKSMPDAKFLIVGDGPLKKQQKDLAKELGIESKVIFTGYRTDIPQVMVDLDISVLSSLSEALAVVNLEAMLMGKPVACFDVGGISELVVNGKTGLLVAPRDYNGLADAIIDLLRNKQKAKQIGFAGRERVEQSFGLNLMVKKHEELYSSLTA
ncbi:MAG: glycosyltransferase [Candidatus Aureabacteria bacterium]|nr:glycosyltransferase [Candidatus Auribacterota bacterium]MCK5161924.1 glycosyltransferase [Candidatus Auribacterota bacterium]